MSDLTSHARRELESIDLLGTEDGDAALRMIEEFAAEGHSGGSAPYGAHDLAEREKATASPRAIELFRKLAAYRPLSPLTGEAHEWVEHDPATKQNTRCPSVFIIDGVAMHIDGIVWEDQDGSRYINVHSRVPITFPYTPTTVYKPDAEDPGRREDAP